MRPSSFVRTILFLNLIFPQTMREWEREWAVFLLIQFHPLYHINPQSFHTSWNMFELYFYTCMCATGFVYESENRCVRMKCLVWSGLIALFGCWFFFKKTRIECYPWQRRLHQTKYHVSHSITGKWTGCYYVECWSLSHILLLLWLLMLLLLLWLRWWLQLLQLLLLAVCNVIVIIF